MTDQEQKSSAKNNSIDGPSTETRKDSLEPEDSIPVALENLPQAVQQEIEKSLEQLLGGDIRPDQISIAVSREISHERRLFQGSVPPVEMAAEYEKLVPGSAKLFIEMAQKEQEYRISCTSKQVDSSVEESATQNKLLLRGQGFGFASLLFCLLFSAAFGYAENYAMAGLFLGATVLGVVGKIISVGVDAKNSRDNQSF